VLAAYLGDEVGSGSVDGDPAPAGGAPRKDG
jgi:hypothetical protein